MKRLPRLTGGGRGVILARLVLWGLGQAAVSVAAALLVRHAFRSELADFPLGLAGVAGAFAGLAVLLMGLRIAERVDAEAMGHRYVSAARARLYSHVMALPLRTGQGLRQGHLMLRFVGDLSALRQWISRGVARLTVSGVAIGAALIVLWFLSPPIAGAVSVVMVVVVLAVLALGPRLRTSVREVRRRRARLAANIGEKIQCAATIQAHGDPSRELKRLRRQNRALVDAVLARARVTALIRTLPEGGMLLATGAALLFVELTAGAGGLDAGTLIGALLLLGILGGPLAELARVFDYRQNFEIARDKILNVLNLQALPNEKANEKAKDKATAADGRDIVFEDVAIAGVLAGVDGTIADGRTVAVMGANGAGKSTLFYLAAGLIRPDRGRVLVGGLDAATAPRSKMRARISIIARDVPLLRGTIESNVRMRWRDAPDAAVQAACDRSGLSEALARFPDGLATRVTEGGASLPAGLRQRVALARAILDDPAVLLLDEPEVELDRDGRCHLERFLHDRTGTTVLITHDPRLAALADETWRIEGGTVVITENPSMQDAA